MTRSSTSRREVKGRRPKIIAREFLATREQRPKLDNLLTSAEQAKLATIATLIEYQTGGVAIYSEGEDAHFLYLIDSGIVRLSQHLPNGDRQVLSFMWPGDLFGIAEDGRYVNSAESLTTAAILSVSSGATAAPPAERTPAPVAHAHQSGTRAAQCTASDHCSWAT